MHAQRRYTLTAACPDRVGIVARVASFIADNQGWILETSHHADDDTQRYFMRIEMRADSLPFGLAEFRRRFQPIADENVATETDASHGMVRVEVNCVRCDGHLGHVFSDGPRPTGQRHCVNSESLVFVDGEDLADLADPAAG